MKTKTMIVTGIAALGLASQVLAAPITLSVSSRIWKGNDQVRYRETGLVPKSPVNYQITGYDCDGPIDYPFMIPSDKFGKDSNTLTVVGCAPYTSMQFCDTTTGVCADF
jgi:hypothetical protein